MSEIKKEDFLYNAQDYAPDTETTDSGTEIVETEDSTEVVPETEMSTETIAEVSDNDALASISNDVHLILVFIIITFVMSCFRSWRKNTVKGV